MCLQLFATFYNTSNISLVAGRVKTAGAVKRGERQRWLVSDARRGWTVDGRCHCASATRCSRRGEGEARRSYRASSHYFYIDCDSAGCRWAWQSEGAGSRSGDTHRYSQTSDTRTQIGRYLQPPTPNPLSMTHQSVITNTPTHSRRSERVFFTLYLDIFQGVF